MPATIYELKTYNPYDAYLNDMGDNRFRYNQFNDKIKGLSEKFQDFIFDTVPADFIKDRVSMPLGLNQNQSKETAKIVMDLILSNLYLGNIVGEVQNRLGVDDQKAKTIAVLVVAELFTPILDDLKKMHIEKFAKNSPPPQIQNNPPAVGDDRIIDLKNS